MLTNYITDDDLKQYHPNLTKQLWSGQATYAIQINEAFSILMDDLHNMDVNPRLLMAPLVIKASGVETTSTTGTDVLANSTAEEDSNYRRFVVNVTAINGNGVVFLDGSSASPSTTWENIASITSTLVGSQSIEITNQYRYYRYRSIPGTSISYSAKLVETIFDRLVVYKAFEIIFADFRKTQGDSWDLLVQMYNSKYQSALSSVKYQVDVDESGSVDDGEEGSNRYYLTL